MFSLLTNPLIILAGGGVLLWTGSFIHRERKSGISGRSSLGTGDEIRKENIANRLEALEKQLEEKERRITSLLEAADISAARLSRMIVKFEKTFYSREAKERAASGMFSELKDEVRGQMNDLERTLRKAASTENIQEVQKEMLLRRDAAHKKSETFSGFHFEPSSVGSSKRNSDAPNDYDESEDYKKYFEDGSEENSDLDFDCWGTLENTDNGGDNLFDSRDSDIQPSDTNFSASCSAVDLMGIFAPKDHSKNDVDQKNQAAINDSTANDSAASGSTAENKGTAPGMTRIEKSKAVRQLLKQNKSREEIAQELALDLSEVDLILNVLNGQWKVA